MSELIEKMKKEMFVAIKEHDQNTSGIIQLTLASIKNAEIEKGEALTEEEMIQVVRKESKKLDDSIEQFQNVDGAEELLRTSEEQKKYISQYLPALMSEDDVAKAVDEAIAQLGATSMQDMGKVMGVVMGKLSGKADGSLVKDVVSKKLQS